MLGSQISSAQPRMPVIGVRISWLMFARNSDLAWFAASAWRLASARARLVRSSSAAYSRASCSARRNSSMRTRSRCTRFHFSVSATASWRTSTGSKGFLRISSRSEAPKASTISSKE